MFRKVNFLFLQLLKICARWGEKEGTSWISQVEKMQHRHPNVSSAQLISRYICTFLQQALQKEVQYKVENDTFS